MTLVTILLATHICQADLDSQVLSTFGAKSASPIGLTLDSSIGAAKAIIRIATGGGRCLVSEDGSAIAAYSGRLDKVGLQPLKMLTTGDRYRLQLHGTSLVAFNVSQETYLSDRKTATAVSTLVPSLLLDSYRTLTIGAQLMLGENINQKDLYLAMIDDRVRSGNPNQTVKSSIGKEFHGSFAQWVGYSQGSPVLAIHSTSKDYFYRVDLSTLKPKRIAWMGWRGFASDYRAMSKSVEPFVVPKSKARWANRSFFMANLKPFTNDPVKGCFAWDGKKLVRTDPYTVVGASVNGKFAWLMNIETNQSWLLKR